MRRKVVWEMMYMLGLNKKLFVKNKKVYFASNTINGQDFYYWDPDRQFFIYDMKFGGH